MDKLLSFIKSSKKFNHMNMENFEKVKRGLLNIINVGETAVTENNQNSRMRKDVKSMLKAGILMLKEFLVIQENFLYN